MSFALYGAAFVDGVSTITAGFLNFVRTSLQNALDGNAGGAYNPSAKLQLGGLGLELTQTSGAAKSVQLASRARTIMQHIDYGTDVGGAGDWDWEEGAGDWKNTGAAPGGDQLRIPLENLPDGQRLDSVTVRFQGGAGHGAAFPPGYPILNIYKVDVDNTATLIGTMTDATAPVATYEAKHNITAPTAPAHTIDLTTYKYIAVLTGEANPNYLPNSFVHGCSAAVTITSLAEF